MACINGKLIVIGAADEGIEVPPLLLISGRRSITGWPSGTSIDSQDTLSFSVLSGVRSMNEVFPLERAAEAYESMMSGKASYNNRQLEKQVQTASARIVHHRISKC